MWDDHFEQGEASIEIHVGGYDTSHRCSACDKRCDIWIRPVEGHPYLRGDMCSECTAAAEKKFIEELTYEDLPLYVSFRWYTSKHVPILQRRLTQGV